MQFFVEFIGNKKKLVEGDSVRLVIRLLVAY
jgi:hypothetical protein